MSIIVAFALVPFVLVMSLLLPALAVQLTLKYWFRPAERLVVEEAWAVRFEERLRLRAPALRT